MVSDNVAVNFVSIYSLGVPVSRHPSCTFSVNTSFSIAVIVVV